MTTRKDAVESRPRRPAPAAAIAAQQRASQAQLEGLRTQLASMIRQHQPLTFVNVARVTGYSKSWLYKNSAARAVVAQARDRTIAGHRQQRASAQAADEEAWRQRALNAEDALKSTRAEVRTLRRVNGELLGRLQDPDGTVIVEERDKLRRVVKRLRSELEVARRSEEAARRSLDAARATIGRLQAAEVHRRYPEGLPSAQPSSPP